MYRFPRTTYCPAVVWQVTKLAPFPGKCMKNEGITNIAGYRCNFKPSFIADVPICKVMLLVYKKTSSKRSAKGFLTLGHIFILKVS